MTKTPEKIQEIIDRIRMNPMRYCHITEVKVKIRDFSLLIDYIEELESAEFRLESGIQRNTERRSLIDL